MCGIAGIVNKDISNDVVVVDIKLMTDIISHRGPDGEGCYIYKNLGLGHRRLAILDLSENGKQPMEFDDLIISFNGEIYNYIEIREELRKLGYQFVTETDTEVIIKAYQQWSEDCVLKFNGMWSFSIFDKKRNKLFISRDRFGIKPFYYYDDKKSFYFGSEIKQILPFVKNRKVDKQILYDFLFLSYHHHNENTFFKDIKSLLPGHNMIFDLNTSNFSIKQYYDLQPQDKRDGSLDETISSYKNEFEASLKLRLRSDVKVGTCLSGGLDSSYVAKIASQNYEGKFTAITAKSIDPKNDESKYAKIVADKYNLNWKITTPSKVDFFNSIDKIIYSQEEPFGSPSIVMQYFVMQKAKEEGCIVMLDGQGGDETLLGYERYYIPYLKTIKSPIKRLKVFKELSDNSKLSYKNLFLYYLYFSFPAIRKYSLLNKNKYILKKNKKYFNSSLIEEFKESSKNLFELQKNELTKIQLQKLLKFEDRNSMAHSIEARVPFIDYRLVENALSVPSAYKIKDGWSKYILRKCYGNDAPKEIVWRKNKFGFEAPINKWMSDKSFFINEIKESDFLSNVVDQNFSFESLDKNTIWKLFNVAKWAKAFNVNY